MTFPGTRSSPERAVPIEPRWIPGRTAGYHPFTSWFVLGEIIRRLDLGRRDYQTYVVQDIFGRCKWAIAIYRFRRHSFMRLPAHRAA